MKKSIIAMTMGDPGGIGPEVILKTFQAQKKNPRLHYVIFGSRAPFEELLKRFHYRISLHFLPHWNPELLKHGQVNFLDVMEPSSRPSSFQGEGKRKQFPLPLGERTKVRGGFDPGKVSKRNAQATLAALEAATKAAVAGEVQAIVTAPINKTTMRFMDAEFRGHTEYLAAQSKTKTFAMMFVSKRLKVTLATIHVPIKDVSQLITCARVFEKIRLTHDFLKKYFPLKNPRIAVCALNPHGRETGAEDEAEIRPGVEKAKKKGICAVGPLSADQLFYDAYEGRFDAVISMYHDQGLGPFKMIAFKDGVNVTLGLPFIRTSPDHGTAFDIAYQGKADPSSFISALKLAERLVCRGRSSGAALAKRK
ncbi:MAG: 4-hydroxythreonine-4-phosphate dehydrogenase PdxA [Candidatus Omnitrophica bacterium]|nr:4-hydroxythreonine-4-phosphate dehydrogenase PdxA [Candidatus Omnitrophota bacterium]